MSLMYLCCGDGRDIPETERRQGHGGRVAAAGRRRLSDPGREGSSELAALSRSSVQDAIHRVTHAVRTRRRLERCSGWVLITSTASAHTPLD